MPCPSSSARSAGARSGADIPMTAAVQLLGAVVCMRAITGQEMPRVDEVDNMVDFVLNGIST